MKKLKPRYSDGDTTIHLGDCIDVMRKMPADSMDAILTDPPYGLGFMGKEWDDLPPGLDFAVEALRVLKPGGHLLAFGGTRTWHRLAVAIEDAGFGIRDSIAWMYGSGFPKSLDVGKALPDWQGWGTALKPAFEPIVVARKPLVGTVAANVLTHGTGALNIDASRIDHDPKSLAWVEKWSGHDGHPDHSVTHGKGIGNQFGGSTAGRFPANVILDESQAAALDEQSGTLKSGKGAIRTRELTSRGYKGGGLGQRKAEDHEFTGALSPNYGDVGGASRFFYCAKAPKSERPVVDGVAHPTVKPLALMRYLIRLVTPAGGVVLDPFLGSGTTMEAAILEGFRVTGIEREPDYWPLIRARLIRAHS